MNKQANTKKGRGGAVVLWAAVAMFVLVAAVLYAGTKGLATGANKEGVRATHQAIEQATVLCYATEGFYPPGLEYIKKNYGVVVNEAEYAVRYEVYAANVMPVIKVSKR